MTKKKFISGKNVCMLSISGLVGATLGYLGGDLSWVESLQRILTSSIGSTIRNGIE